MASTLSRSFTHLRNSPIQYSFKRLLSSSPSITRPPYVSSPTRPTLLISHSLRAVTDLTRISLIRCRFNRSGSYSTLNNSSSSNFSDRPPSEIAPLFPGCDYEHWLIVMDKPGGEGATKQQMIDTYIQTLAKVLGSEDEAKKKIYNVSCERYFGFGCEIDEETANKMEGLPGVLFVLPDSYVDAEYKDYGGFDNLSYNGVEAPKMLSSRIEKLPRKESVGCVFQRWMGEGFAVHRGEIFHAINRLRKLKLNKRALEVMEWVIREKPYKPKELDYSYLLEFTIKLHGISHGERLFSNVPVMFQNDLLYNNLVIACLDKGVIRLSLEYMKKMRELGHPISHLVFNRLIILHSSPSRRKIIPKILAQMRADKVTSHVSTFNILLKIEANDHNIERLMKVFEDMKRSNVEPNEVTYCILATAHAVARLYCGCETYVEAIEKSKTGNNWSTFDVLIILYGYLGNPKELDRIWRIVQGFPHVRSKSFLLAIEAFGRIQQLNRAEELWEELKSKKGINLTEQYNSIISVYCKNGLIDKVSGLFKEMKMQELKPNAITYRHLALGCLKAGLTKEALKTLEMGSKQIASSKVKKSTPWLETTLSILEILAEIGDVENVEKLFEELKKANYTRNTFVYNSLIKAYVRAKVYDQNLLKRMILGGARPDAETYSLIKLVEQFRT